MISHVYLEHQLGQQRVPLHVHAFAPDEASAHRPAIIFYHGGGFAGGRAAQFFYHAGYFAERGMTAFSVQYRLDESQKNDGTTPWDAVARGKAAYRWIRTHAAQLAIDPACIAVAGSSAGGHVAAAVALLPGFDHPDDDTSIPCDPAAMALYNPVTDTTARGYQGRWADHDPPIDVLNVHPHVSSTSPPTIIMHPRGDETVPYENSHRLAERFTETGVRCDLHDVPGATHGYIYSAPVSKEAVQSLRDTDWFLASLGWLRGAPTAQFQSA